MDKKPFAVEEGSCVYYGQDGKLRCGIGCAVPMKVAQELEESGGGSISGIAEHNPEVFEKTGLPSENMDFLQAVQLAHDHTAALKDTPDKERRNILIGQLVVIARSFGLEVPRRG